MTMTTLEEKSSQAAASSWIDGPMLGFDLETTGVKRFFDVPVSAAIIRGIGEAVVRKAYHLINPDRPVPEEAAAVHGITSEVASLGMPLTDAVALLVAEVEDAKRTGTPIVGMNLSYDLTMLDVLARRLLGETIDSPDLLVLDVLVIDRQFDRYRRGKRTLANLADHYGVVLANAHDALGDTEAALRVLRAEAVAYPALTKVGLAELTRQQKVSHKIWAKHYSSWRVENGMTPLDPEDFEWPIAKLGDD